MITRRSWFAALLLTFVLAVSVSAQRSMIRGKVHTSNGNPVNNAIVELRVSEKLERVSAR